MQNKNLKGSRLFRTAALLLALLLFFSIPAAQRSGLLSNAAAADGDPVRYILVGLRWGSTECQSADLQNDGGTGFDFGYLDERQNFVTLGSTDENSVSILKDWTMSRNEKNNQYEQGYFGKVIVGSRHVLLESYASRREAELAAAVYTDGFTAWVNGEWYVCAGSYYSENEVSEAIASRELEGEIFTGSNRCVTVVETKTGRILFEFDDNAGRSLAVMPRESRSGNVPTTMFSTQHYRGGFQFTRSASGNLTVVNFVTMDDYAACVTAAEMSTSWPIEALKAQAVAAKTYAAVFLNHHSKYGFDVCESTECQRYRGVVTNMESCDTAARETSGVYLTYEDEYAYAFYYASNGGATEDSENVFTIAIPYLRGKLDPYEEVIHIPYDGWNFDLTGEELAAALRKSGRSCSDIVAIRPVYTSSGNVYSLTFTDEDGKQITVEKDTVRTLINLGGKKNTLSLHYTVTANTDAAGQPDFYVNDNETRLKSAQVYALTGSGEVQSVDLSGRVTLRTAEGNETIGSSRPAEQDDGTIYADSFHFAGDGYGHNVGMSQFGAKAMAELGHTYREILEFYYTGVTIG